MTPVVVDASALAAVVFQEPGFERVAVRLQGAPVHAPALLKFEMANVALFRARRSPAAAARIFELLSATFDPRSAIAWHDVHVTDVAVLAHMTGITAYDASYVWLAGTLGADLVTLDKRLAWAVAAMDQD